MLKGTIQLTKFTYFYPDKAKLIRINQPLFYKLHSPEWCAQKKYNGSRLQLHYANGHFQFWNRHNQLLSYQPNQEMVEALTLFASSLKGYWLFDGELRHNKVVGVYNKMVLWDVFVAEGELINHQPYWRRLGLLTDKMPDDPYGQLALIDTYYSNCDFKLLFEESIKDPEIEGLVLKNRNGHLLLGRTRAQESPWMFKVRKATGRHKY